MDSRIALKPQTKLYFYDNEGGKILYTIVREIGRGSSCIVYEASHETTTGDRKLYRIKECYPYKLQIHREESGSLVPNIEDKKLFLEYVDAWGIVDGESVTASFVTGFRLGAKFAYDTFVLPESGMLKEGKP